MSPSEPVATDPPTSPSGNGRRRLVTVGLAVFAAAMWLAFLGWDDEYYTVDGVAHGPYRTWQVVGCSAAIALAAVLAYLRTRGAIVPLAAAATVGFAVPWSWYAAATDDSGLWGVGLLCLLIGAGSGLTLLLAVCAAVVPRRDRPRPHGR